MTKRTQEDLWGKKKDSMRFYDATASSYEELYGKEQQTKHDAALRALGVVRLGKVLDVGCGPSAFLRRIVPSSTFRVGVDVSRGMLMNVRTTDRHSMHLLCADADFLPIRDGAFDSVFAFTLLQNMPCPAETTREILRVARPEGTVVVTLPAGSEIGREARHWLEEICVSHRVIEGGDPKDYILVCVKPDQGKQR